MSDTLNAETDQVHDDTPQSQSDDAESKALRMGWRPKEEFKGDETKWVDAETFVKRGEEVLPFVQANNKALEKSNKELASKLAKVERTLKEFGDFHSKTEKRMYAQAMQDLEERHANAVEAGDLQAARAVTKEMTALVADATPERSTEAHPNGWTADYASAVDSFQEANPWFGSDRTMTIFAKGLDEELAADGMEPKARLKEIARQARVEFPQKFENPARRNAAAVEGGGNGRPAGGGKTYANLPPEAKAQCDRFVKSIPGFTRDKFIQSYEWG